MDRRVKPGDDEMGQDNRNVLQVRKSNNTNRWRGLIAQDVLQTHPHAVVGDENGLLTVDHNGLNVSLQAA
jgi:hypothetical protein